MAFGPVWRQKMAARFFRAGGARVVKGYPSVTKGDRSRPPSTLAGGSLSLSLPKSIILRGYRSFALVLSEGASFSSPPVRMFLRRTRETSTPFRVGFTVSRSVRSAAARNTARRRLKEAFRLNQAIWRTSFSPRKGVEAVWMYTGDPVRIASFEIIRKSVWKLMEQARKA